MKKILIVAAMLMSATAFAQTTETKFTPVTQTAEGNAVAQAQAGALSGSQATNQGNAQTINFNAPDATQATREAGAADIQVALINAQAARDIAATAQVIKNTPSVNGPNLTTSNDTCMGSTSGSVNIAGLGIGGGTSWVDGNCKMLKNSREMWNMGMKAAALALMCTDSANMEALELTGFVCPQTAAKAKAAEAKAAPAKVSAADQPQYTDPIVRARLGLEPLVAAK